MHLEVSPSVEAVIVAIAAPLSPPGNDQQNIEVNQAAWPISIEKAGRPSRGAHRRLNGIHGAWRACGAEIGEAE